MPKKDKSPVIIIDRKEKRKNFDNQWSDPLGVEDAKKEKARTINVDKDAKNPIDRFLCYHPLSELLGKKVWAVKSDRSRFFEGWVVDIYPSRHILIKEAGTKMNMPMEFDSVIAMEG